MNAYFEMIDMEDNVYRNKYAVRCAVGTIRCLRKLEIIKGEEEGKFTPEFDVYKNSEEYHKL